MTATIGGPAWAVFWWSLALAGWLLMLAGACMCRRARRKT
jgi:hypothetical protein